jgi:ankyrin repeat protein
MLAALDIEEINKQNSRGQTALYCASRRNHKPFVLALLQLEGINVNCQARTHGSTPLHGASFGGYANIVALLLAAGADPRIENYPESPGTAVSSSYVNNLGAPPLTPREEARGEAIKAYMMFEQGKLLYVL